MHNLHGLYTTQFITMNYVGLSDSAFFPITIVAGAIVMIFDSFPIDCLTIMDLSIPSVNGLMQKYYDK